MQSNFVKIYLCFLLLTSFACKRKPLAQSQPSLIGGKEISESEMPEVVKLSIKVIDGTGLCTGTFIGATDTAEILITAAHCVSSEKEGAMTLEANAKVSLVEPGSDKPSTNPSKQSTKVFRSTRYSYDGNKLTPNDVAIVLFPKGAAQTQQFAKLATRDVNPGDTVYQVGYGCNQADSDLKQQGGHGTKRAGTNTVTSRDGGVLSHKGSVLNNNATGQGVVNCPGDSGGPLFIEGTHEIVGIASTVGMDPQGTGDAESNFNDVRWPATQKFLLDLKAQNVVIPGVDEKLAGQDTGSSVPQPQPPGQGNVDIPPCPPGGFCETSPGSNKFCNDAGECFSM